MKRLIKILAMVFALIVSTTCLFACNPSGSSSEKGLIVKQIKNKDTFAVVKYVDDGRESTVLDIGLEAEKLSLQMGKTVVISSILKEAFSGNDTLTEIIVPSTVEEIGEGAFSKTLCLEKLTVPFIGKNATGDTFYGETSSATGKAVNKERTFGYFFGKESFEGSTPITQQFVLDEQELNPDGTTADGSTPIETSFVYYSPLSLKEVVVAPKQTENGYGVPMYAFAGNGLLNKVVLNGKFRAIGDSAFNGCTRLDNVVIPQGVKRIGDGVFYNCINLKNLTFEENCLLEDIGGKAFSGIQVENMVLPANVKTIKALAFSPVLAPDNISVLQDTKIKTVVLPEGLAVLESQVFFKCTNLEKITLPSTLTEIKGLCFAYCSDFEIVSSNWNSIIKGEGWNFEGNFKLAD